jgi:hypothetical protein
MSLISFAAELDSRPDVADAIVAVFRVLRSTALSTTNPTRIASSAGIDVLQALAALGALEKQGLGDFTVAVVDSVGRTVAEFDSWDAAEQADASREGITDRYGDHVSLQPSNARVLFRPADSLLVRLREVGDSSSGR